MAWAQGFCFEECFVLFYRVKNAIRNYISEAANKRNKGSRLQKCSVYWGKIMCLNRDTDTAYILSPPGISAKVKLGKECKGASSSQLPTSLAQVHRCTWANRQKHQLFIFQYFIFRPVPCFHVQWSGKERCNRIE